MLKNSFSKAKYFKNILNFIKIKFRKLFSFFIFQQKISKKNGLQIKKIKLIPKQIKISFNILLISKFDSNYIFKFFFILI
jgi:hypothetical protein